MRLSPVVVLAVLLAACAGAESAPSSTTATTVVATTGTTTIASTTTTAGQTTTSTAPDGVAEPVAPADVDGTVGYVGCSMSQNAVEGYETVGGSDLWSFRAPYGGGGIGRWFVDIDGDRGRYWEGFDAELASHPDTSVLWLNICTVRQNRLDSLESAAAVIEEITERIPGVTIYVSAQPSYTDGHFCSLAGEGGPEAMAEVAAAVVDSGLALPGPVMGPLSGAQTRDGCHANEEGQRVLGRQLLDFFG
jgi:hypothetical protein